MNNRTAIYHPTAKGDGAALTVEVTPANEMRAGYIKLGIVPQMKCKQPEGAPKVFPWFKWIEEVKVRLHPLETTQLIEVFTGVSEDIHGGITSQSCGKETTFNVRHVAEPSFGYEVSIKVKEEVDGKRKTKTAIFRLTPTEAFMLTIGLQQIMPKLLFAL